MTSMRGLLVLAAALAIFAAAQGPATRDAPPAARAAPSGRSFPVTFTDVAREAGLRMSFTSGSEQSKKYIIEANGTGVAFLDYDNDGRQDVFLVNGSRLEGFPKGDAPTNRLYRNGGEGRFVLHDVLAGTYVVQVRATGRGEASVTGVRVVAGRTTNLGTSTAWGTIEIEVNHG